jgi:hypothetical protein
MHFGADGSMIMRHVKGSRKMVPCPPVMPFYNKHMGGVDQQNHMTKVYGVLRKCYQWTNVFFYSFLDTAVVNSYIMFKQLHPDVSGCFASHISMCIHCLCVSQSKLSHSDFHQAVVSELVALFSDHQAAHQPPILDTPPLASSTAASAATSAAAPAPSRPWRPDNHPTVFSRMDQDPDVPSARNRHVLVASHADWCYV